MSPTPRETPLQVVSLLSEMHAPFFRALVPLLAELSRVPLVLDEAGTWQEREGRLDRGEAAGAFLCGLLCARQGRLIPLAAPATSKAAAAGGPAESRASYTSEVVVRHASPARDFGALRGARFGFNEPGSWSGYCAVQDHLSRLGETSGYFAEAHELGSHLGALEAVLDGQVDAAAIDSTVLGLYLDERPERAGQLRTVASLGPFPAPPFAVNAALGPEVRDALGRALLTLGTLPSGQNVLSRARISCFAPATLSDYDVLLARAAAATAVPLAPLRVGPRR